MCAAPDVLDAVVVGGGFYGTAVAIYLAKARNFKKVLIVERERTILQRASYNNQARVHNGYHYPRSFTTAYRSRINLPRFVSDWPRAIKNDFVKLYAIARRNSKVNASQFERFCRSIGAPIRLAGQRHSVLFEPRLIEQVFEVEEFSFDSVKLAEWAAQELQQLGIRVLTDTRATEFRRCSEGVLGISLKAHDDKDELLRSKYLFNCTYAGLNQFGGDFPGISTGLKQEITEMALMRLPEELDGLGVTVMDGSYFSVMPFPARRLHTLSHVRYTPHTSWVDQRGINPYEKLQNYHRDTRVDRMLRDVARYFPSLAKADYVDSLFEVKTVLMRNEGDDGRPIFFERHTELPGCYSILGGKIDNIYDALEKLDKEVLAPNKSS
jgi:glycine/D-amino acid oxidase-like deaminating enzyme